MSDLFSTLWKAITEKNWVAALVLICLAFCFIVWSDAKDVRKENSQKDEECRAITEALRKEFRAREDSIARYYTNEARVFQRDAVGKQDELIQRLDEQIAEFKSKGHKENNRYKDMRQRASRNTKEIKKLDSVLKPLTQ